MTPPHPIKKSITVFAPKHHVLHSFSHSPGFSLSQNMFDFSSFEMSLSTLVFLLFAHALFFLSTQAYLFSFHRYLFTVVLVFFFSLCGYFFFLNTFPFFFSLIFLLFSTWNTRLFVFIFSQPFLFHSLYTLYFLVSTLFGSCFPHIFTYFSFHKCFFLFILSNFSDFLLSSTSANFPDSVALACLMSMCASIRKTKFKERKRTFKTCEFFVWTQKS